jgi:hypothetical protein
LKINFAESFLQEREPLEFGYEELAIRSKQIKSDSNSNSYSNELVDDANKVRIEDESDNDAFTITLKSATSTSTSTTATATTTSTKTTTTTTTSTVFSDLNRSSESNVIDDGNDAVEATTTTTLERKNVPNNELSNYFEGKEGQSLAEKNPLKDDDAAASKNVERLSDSGGVSINSTKEVSRKKIWSQGFRYKMQEFLRKNQQRIRGDQEAQTSRTSKVHFLII